MADSAHPFWSRDPQDVMREAGASAGGLTAGEAAGRLARYGANVPAPPPAHAGWRLLLGQFRSPIAVLLLVTAGLSAFLGESVDAAIILLILVASAGLGSWQERRAAVAIADLLSLIRTRATVLRDGRETDVPVEEVVPGDVVVLNAGDLIPADCRVLTAKDLDVDEAVLTGESFPVPKDAEPAPADAGPGERRCALFAGSHVVTGTGTAVVVATGAGTVYGEVAGKLARRAPDSEFDRGVRRFGYLLLEITAALVLVVFAVNASLGRPTLDDLLFSLALAVGLTPQLLPAIVSVTLAAGARRMAERQVVVRRLVAIEDFGGMSVLATDKTGTLTEGTVRVRCAVGPGGEPSAEAGRLAYLNAALQSGFDNPIDAALRASPPADASGDGAAVRKLDEVPYDFGRRRLSVLVEGAGGARTLITKGAVPEVVGACTRVRTDTGGEEAMAAWAARIETVAGDLGRQGLRCLGVAYRRMDGATTASRDDEREMVFAGLVALADPPKPGTREAVERLRSLGIEIKMVTGDNRLVAAAVAREVGLRAEHVVTGAQVRRLSEAALRRRAASADVFAEVDPTQKERIILALKAAGTSVGYLGDGINDAAALHAADVGISVDTAADVTKQAAAIVLLRKDLGVLAEGVEEGRRAFANTLKYVFVTTSANFGNMFSMAGASLMAAFLPMLPKQILLLNLLSDLPAMAIATDRLDPELVRRPRRWDIRYIRDFMLTFGLVSSAFDYLTFGLLLALAVPPAEFRTGWFIESVLTELLVLLVIRTARLSFRSLPSRPLLLATLGVAAVTLALPYVPGADVFGFVPLPAGLMLGLLGIAAGLVGASEAAKRLFFRWHPLGGGVGARRSGVSPTIVTRPEGQPPSSPEARPAGV